MCVSLTVILRLKTYTYGVYAQVLTNLLSYSRKKELLLVVVNAITVPII